MENIITTFHPKHLIEESGPYPKDWIPWCTICGKRFSFQSTSFYCRICDFYFHKECAAILMESELTINCPETHEHTLTFIRQKNSFKCEACGEVRSRKMNMYACLLCDFFVHRNCMYLPKVIKLTCHSHRLFHTFQVSDWNKKCPICDQEFVRGYGGYICVDKTCDYKLHSYCATDTKVWDGKHVEKEPEETSHSEEDGGASSSLEDIDCKLVRHFSHHLMLMRLCVNDEEEEEELVCQACILPIDFDGFLACKECDFALHDTCANLPRKMEHALHRHQLILEVNVMNSEQGFFSCFTCKRESCGFMYRCCEDECGFKIDANCASLALADPLYIGTHQHPFCLKDTDRVRCCKCYFSLHFERATLPALVKHKHDIHPLTLYLNPTVISHEYWSPLWCEICELKIKEGYPGFKDLYGCADCNTSLHVECVIGKHPYLKPGHTIKVNDCEIEIASNSVFSRYICHACHYICQDKLVFKNRRDDVSYCSIDCTSGKLPFNDELRASLMHDNSMRHLLNILVDYQRVRAPAITASSRSQITKARDPRCNHLSNN